MAAPATDERLHRDAIVALLTGPLEGHIYNRNEVPGAEGVDGSTNPGALPDTYTMLDVERDPVLITSTSGRAGQSAWAASFEISARTVDNVRRVQSVIAANLEGVRLTIGGADGLTEFESATKPKPTEGGRIVATYVVAYVLT